jgi:hypothetical protein
VSGAVLATFIAATIVFVVQGQRTTGWIERAEALQVYSEKANELVREMELQRALQAE